MSKRIQIFEPIGDGSRDRGENSFGLEMAKDGLRKMKVFSEVESFPLDTIRSVDCFRDGEVKGGAASGAAAGAVLFGAAGAIIGGLANAHKDAWYLELTLNDAKRMFRFANETDKNTFTKWAAKHGL